MVLRVPTLMITLTLAAGALVVASTPTAAATSTPVLAKRIIGYSVQHRPIVAYHLGDPSRRRSSLILGQMHGDEHAGVTVVKSIIHGARSVEGINLWVIPTMNPDGDAAHTRQNAHGVDLNRNWPYRWRPLNEPYYSGAKPLSEPESQAMARFLRQVRPRFIVSLHQPLDGVDLTDTYGAADTALRDALARNLHLPKKAFNCWSYCYGSMSIWYEHKHLGYCNTVEFGWSPSRYYLEGQVRRGIISALGGHLGSLAAHDPRLRLALTSEGRSVRFTGWAYDIDRRDGRLLVQATEGGATVGAHGHWAQQPSPNLNRRRGLTGGHAFSFRVPAPPGPHSYCLSARNVGAGTKDARTCATITVGATA